MRPRFTRNVRDGILFFAGLAGAGYETIFQQVDRPELLVLFAGMMGLPAFLRGDERYNPPPPPWWQQPPPPPPPVPPKSPPTPPETPATKPTRRHRLPTRRIDDQ
jgi:hypothetical protein